LKNVTKFTSAINGQLKSLNRTNVTADAKYRALQTAIAMRTENPGMYVYSIGLGNSVDQAFLQQIANDPASSTYDPNQPVGEAVFASNSAHPASAALNCSKSFKLSPPRFSSVSRNKAAPRSERPSQDEVLTMPFRTSWGESALGS
jgi:hypothetical protein